MSLSDCEFRFWPEPAHRYRARTVADEDYSSSPLLLLGHHYSYPLPSSRTRAIQQGQRELMEMVRGMPESSFELSLKDIVDEQRSPRELRKEEGSVSVVKEVEKEKQKGCKKRKKGNVAATGLRMDRCRVSRTSSMDSGSTFMIKMFFPAFLTSRKAAPAKGGNSRLKSKVLPRTLVDGLENREDCESGCKKSSAESEQRTHKKLSHSNGSSSCKGETLPSCWPFQMTKGKMRRQRTCSF